MFAREMPLTPNEKLHQYFQDLSTAVERCQNLGNLSKLTGSEQVPLRCEVYNEITASARHINNFLASYGSIDSDLSVVRELFDGAIEAVEIAEGKLYRIASLALELPEIGENTELLTSIETQMDAAVVTLGMVGKALQVNAAKFNFQ